MSLNAAKFWQDRFDPTATLIVAAWPAGYTHKGRTPRRGEILDKAGVAPNILRALFESRWVRMAEEHEVAARKVLTAIDVIERAAADPIMPEVGVVDPKAAYAEKAAAETPAPAPRKRNK